MAKKRREYTDDFKRDAVRLVTEQGYGVTEACHNLNISTSMFRRWRLQFDPQSSTGAGNSGLSSAEREEFESLRREVKRLRMEREVLKKTVIFFANEST
jgi:transposase